MRHQFRDLIPTLFFHNLMTGREPSLRAGFIWAVVKPIGCGYNRAKQRNEPPMKIATWNINGVKARIENLCQWLKDSNPDIVCLQEIKTVDEGFPRLEIEALGYHVETHGQKGFNGVAILSKTKPDEVRRGLPGDDSDEQARFIEAVFSVEGHGALRVCCLYLPNGNPVDTEKYPYKLAWMERLRKFALDHFGLGGASDTRRRLQRHSGAT